MTIFSDRDILESSTPQVRVSKFTKKRKDTKDVATKEALVSQPRRDANATIEEQNLLPPYFWPRRVEAPKLKLPMNVHSFLDAP